MNRGSGFLLLLASVGFFLAGCSSSAPVASGSQGGSGSAHGNDGTLRIDVKHGTDPDAALIDRNPKDLTVEELLANHIPGDLKGNLEDYADKRIGDFEKSTFRVTGTLKSVIKRKDGDFFLVMAGKTGAQAVIEIPDPKLTKGSPIQPQIEAARSAIESKYHPTDKIKPLNETATIEGVGFFGTKGKAGAGGANSAPRLMPGTGFKS